MIGLNGLLLNVRIYVSFFLRTSKLSVTEHRFDGYSIVSAESVANLLIELTLSSLFNLNNPLLRKYRFAV